MRNNIVKEKFYVVYLHGIHGRKENAIMLWEMGSVVCEDKNEAKKIHESINNLFHCRMCKTIYG